MKYLINIYIIDFRDRFIKTFINQMLHFDIIITSREKDAHEILKRQLNVSIEDLKTIIKMFRVKISTFGFVGLKSSKIFRKGFKSFRNLAPL